MRNSRRPGNKKMASLFNYLFDIFEYRKDEMDDREGKKLSSLS